MKNEKSRKALCIALAAITALTMNLGCAAEVFAEDTEESANVTAGADETTTPASGDTEEDTDNGETDGGDQDKTADNTAENVSDPIETVDTPMLLAAEEEAVQGISIDDKNFPDPVFKQYVNDNFDTDNDGVLSAEEISAATVINLNESGVASLDGIQFFTELEELNCDKNSLTSIDVSKNTKLKKLVCSHNQLSSVDVSQNTELLKIDCGFNQITSLDTSKNTHLERLDCFDNKLTSLDVTNNPELLFLNCGINELTSLDLSKNAVLYFLCCSYNNIVSLDITNVTKLEYLDCKGNKLTSLDLSDKTALKDLNCAQNQLTALDVSKNTALESLSCFFNNNIAELDLSNNTLLTFLLCSDNKLTYLDISNNNKLEMLDCCGNNLTSLDLSGTNIKDYYCEENTYDIILKNGIFDLAQLKGFDVSRAHNWQGAKYENGVLSEFEGIDGKNIVTYEYDIGNGEYVTFTLVYYGEGIAVDSTVFPDENFRKFILDNIDTDGNGVLEYAEIKAVKKMDVSNMGINDMTGIGIFTELTDLNFSNNEFTPIDVSSNNGFNSLDLSSNINLEILDCRNSWVDKLDISGCTALTTLLCGDNLLDDLDISGNPNLSILDCSYNSIGELDTSNNPVLWSINCSHNVLKKLDFSGNPNITLVNCSRNRLTSLYAEDIFDVTCNDNFYSLGTISGGFELSKLPGNFDPNKASDWQGAKCENGRLVDITGINGENIITYTYDCGNGNYARFSLLYIVDDGISELSITEEYFPDEAFRAYISENFDKDKNGSLSQEERLEITQIYASDLGITSVKGIEYFRNLRKLFVDKNKISELDLSRNQMIGMLSCDNNNMTKLILGNKPILDYLDCYDNALTSLDISNAPSLATLGCENNKLTDIDVSKNEGLQYLNISNNELTSIDISDNYLLNKLFIENNHLTSLNASNIFDIYVYTIEVKGNIFNIAPIDGMFDLSSLPGYFNSDKASNWQGAEYADGILKNITGIPSGKDGIRYITYDYDIGNGHTEKFTLAYKAETAAEDKPETPAAPTNNYPTPVLPANGVSNEGAAYTADGTAKGWVSIEKAVKNAKKGAVITINMNSNEVVSKRIFKRAMGKDITLVFNSGIYTWTVNGKDITTPKNVHFCAHTADEKLSGKALSDRSYGFTAKLTVSLDGKYASLFHYHTSADELKYTDSCKIKDGKAEFTVDRSANYVIVTSDKPVKEFTAE